MKITKATELNNKKSCYLIYANPGMGKTTAIKFIKGKTLLIDIDKSSIVLKGEKNIDIVEVDTHNIFDNWISIVTDWETSDVWTDESTGQMYNRSMPDIRLKILNNFLGLCDVVARLVCKKDESGEIVRGFILEPLNSVYAKNRLDNRKGCKVEELITNV